MYVVIVRERCFVLCVCVQFFPGDSQLQLDWLRNVAEMRIQQATQDPSPTKIEPLVALLDKLGQNLPYTPRVPLSYAK